MAVRIDDEKLKATSRSRIFKVDFCIFLSFGRNNADTLLGAELHVALRAQTLAVVLIIAQIREV
jgi:hypothetical protein